MPFLANTSGIYVEFELQIVQFEARSNYFYTGSCIIISIDCYFASGAAILSEIASFEAIASRKGGGTFLIVC